MLFFFYAQAQDIKFTWNGTDLKDGDKIEIKAEAIDYGGGFVLVTAETNNDKNNLRLVNMSDDYVDATVTATIVSTTCTAAPMLQLCCGGDCSASTSKPIKKEVGFDVGTSMKAMMDASFQAVDNYGDFVTTLSAANNGKSTTITIVFSYKINDSENDSSCKQLQTGDHFEFDGKGYTIVGENLIENPSFDNGVTGWLGGDGNALGGATWNSTGGADGGAYIIPRDFQGKAGNKSIGTAWPIKIGKIYVFSYYINNISSPSAVEKEGYIVTSQTNTPRGDETETIMFAHEDANMAWTQNIVVTEAQYGYLQFCARWLGGTHGFDAFILAEVIQDADPRELSELVANCEEWLKNGFDEPSGESVNAFMSVIEEAKATLDIEAPTAVLFNAMIAKLQDALLDYRIANADENHTVDVTDRYIKNPCFDKGMTNWDIVNSAVNNGCNIRVQSYFQEKIDRVLEINGNPSVETSAKQTINGLPNGQYIFSVDCVMTHSAITMDATSLSGAAIVCNGVELDMKTQRMTCSDAAYADSYPERFEVCGSVTDGKITVGLVAMSGSKFTYIAIDNVKLEYKGPYTGQTDVSQNTLAIDNRTAYARKQFVLPLLMKNESSISAYQCDLYLPEGITIAKDQDDFYMVELCEDRTTAKNHNTLEVAQQTNGAYRIMCASTKNYTFEGTDGCVAYLTLNVDADVADGYYEIWLWNVTLSTAESVIYEPDDVKAILTVKSYEMGDVTCDGKVNVGDYTAMVQLIMNPEEDSFERALGDFNKNGVIEVGDLTALVNVIMTSAASSASAMRKAAPLRAAAATAEENRLEIVPFTISAGEEKKISLNMINAMTVSAYQTDVVLPAGIEIVKEDGFYLVDLSAERTTARNHNTMEAEKQADGSVRIMCASTKNCEFSGNDGEVAVITVKAADNLSAGVYTLELKNTTFSTASSVTYEPVTGKQTVFAGDLTEMSAVPALYGNYTEEGIAAFNAAFDENSVATSFDLTSVTAMDASVALTTANPNAVIYVAEGMSVKNECNVVEGDVCANLVLTDGKPFGPAKTFTVKAGEYSRTLSADTYGTIVLPFAPDAETMKGYTFYELTGVETNALTFDEVANPVAGKPYIVTGDGTATKMSAEAESTVVIEPAATEADGWTMTGTYESVVFTDADELASLYCISGNQFKQATSKLTMNPFRAYFVGDGSVNSITLRGDDGTTNIISLNSQSSILNSPLYDLQGRQVEHAEQGIYIQNGKKVLVK